MSLDLNGSNSIKASLVCVKLGSAISGQQH